MENKGSRRPRPARPPGRSHLRWPHLKPGMRTEATVRAGCQRRPRQSTLHAKPWLSRVQSRAPRSGSTREPGNVDLLGNKDFPDGIKGRVGPRVRVTGVLGKARVGTQTPPQGADLGRQRKGPSSTDDQTQGPGVGDVCGTASPLEPQKDPAPLVSCFLPSGAQSEANNFVLFEAPRVWFFVTPAVESGAEQGPRPR